ncbi:hypothetical protein O6V14_05350 [Sphingomonas faeni]|uniref:hypothetical protein n=1 Tax=Sphingomonas faeni TaxID=185950 RepID=UPI00334D7C10
MDAAKIAAISSSRETIAGADMKTMDTLEEMRMHLTEGACAPTLSALGDMLEYIDGPIERASFTELFGAPVHLIESRDDMAIVRPVEVGEGTSRSLLESASEWFDVAEWIDDGCFARFVAIDSADGGKQYLVPKRVAEQVISVDLSIELVATRAG